MAGLFGFLKRRLGHRVYAGVGTLCGLLVAADLGLVAGFMIENHPHQNVYFNSLVGGVRGAQGEYEMDYWGLSYRKGLEYILESDRASRIAVNYATLPGRYNAGILPAAERRRIVFVRETHQARYYITNFRWERGQPPGGEIYSVRVDGVPLMSVFRIE
jgi:hypothetical protein